MSFPDTPAFPRHVVQRGRWPGRYMVVAFCDGQMCESWEEAESLARQLAETWDDRVNIIDMHTEKTWEYKCSTGLRECKGRSVVEPDPRRAVFKDRPAIIHMVDDLTEYLQEWSLRSSALVLPRDLVSALQEGRPDDQLVRPETEIWIGYSPKAFAEAVSDRSDKHVVTFGEYSEKELNKLGCYHVNISEPGEIDAWASGMFMNGEMVTKLGGAEFHDTHKCRNKKMRDKWRTYIHTKLGDRVQCLGDCAMDTYTGWRHAVETAHHLLPAPRLDQVAKCGTPVISIAAGPSLTEYMPALRELQNKCLLIACDAALPGLLKNDVVPHMVTPLERVDAVIPLCVPAKGTDVIYAGLPVVHPDAVGSFKHHLALTCGDRLYKWLRPHVRAGINTGSSTGVLSASVAMALASGTAPVYLVGHDLCMSGTKSHYDGAPDFVTQSLRDQQKKLANTTCDSYKLRDIPGTNGKTVKAIAWWDRFRVEISVMANLYHAQTGHRIINVLPNGALIDGTVQGSLPRADSLATFHVQLPPKDQAQYDEWYNRAKHVPEQAQELSAHFQRHLDHSMPVMERVKGMRSSAGIGVDNAHAFQYVLRSQVWYANVFMHQHCMNTPVAHARTAAHVAMDRMCNVAADILDTLDWTAGGILG